MKTATAVILIVVSASLAAQAPRAFEAASVRRNRTNGAGLPPVIAITGQRLNAPFVTARELIRVAYGVYDNQVVNGPGWIDSDRFDVSATISPNTPADVAREMLRSLLAERFGLAVRREKRELPVHVLTFSGKFGPKMRVSGPDCAPLAGPPGIPAPPPPPPPPAGAGPLTVLGQPPGSKCGTVRMRGFVSARDIPLETFCYLLMGELGRPVIDRTDLTARYDIDLTYLPDTGPMTINGTAINADAPPLTTAVREQLGLKLDSTRAPVDVIVIDRVNAPTEN